MVHRSFHRLRSLTMFMMIVTALLVLPRRSSGQDDLPSPRLTPLVKVIRAIEPAVVALFTPVQNQLVFGSGTVIHEDGYVLTNNHVLPQAEGYALLPGLKPLRFRVVGRLPETDLAIIRILDAPKPMPIVAVGRSADLMNGETVVVAGNPGGRGTVFTSGIISSKDLLEGGVNALVMTNYENSRRDRFIQFDAASNRGNSGGPLVNLEGSIIGIVSAGVAGEQNVGIAIPIDRVRRQFEQMLDPELIHQRSTGLSTDHNAGPVTISSIAEGSAASMAGLQVGDEIESVNGRRLRQTLDWFLMLETLLPQNIPLQLSISRKSEVRSFEIVPRETPPLAAVDTPTVEPGLDFAFYHGKFDFLPDFAKLNPERTGTIEGIQLKTISGSRNDYFATTLDGYLNIERDGLYRFVMVSDDGSRLLLHGQTVIDHDGNHPPKPAGRLIRLKKGLHPLRIEFFQGNGEKELRLFYEFCDSRETLSLKPLREVTPDRFSRAVKAP